MLDPFKKTVLNGMKVFYLLTLLNDAHQLENACMLKINATCLNLLRWLDAVKFRLLERHQMELL